MLEYVYSVPKEFLNGSVMKKLLFLFLSCISVVVNAETFTRSELIEIMKGAFSAINSQSIDSTIKQLRGGSSYPMQFAGQLSREKQQILLSSFKRFAQEPAYVEFFVDQMIQMGINKKEDFRRGHDNTKKFFNVGLLINDYLYKEGLKRASAKELLSFFNYQIALSQEMTPRVCKAFNYGIPIKDIDLERTLANLRLYKKYSVKQLQDLENHFFNTRMAYFNSSIAELSPTDQELASSAFQRSLVEELKKSSNPHRIADAFTNYEQATDQDACEASIVMFKALVGGSGKARELKMHWFITNVF